jgi:AcrR family transcriptional regulator
MPRQVDDERVLREAARLFRKQGYSATTVRQIAKAACMLLTYGLMEEQHRPRDFRKAFEGT